MYQFFSRISMFRESKQNYAAAVVSLTRQITELDRMPPVPSMASLGLAALRRCAQGVDTSFSRRISI